MTRKIYLTPHYDLCKEQKQIADMKKAGTNPVEFCPASNPNV